MKKAFLVATLATLAIGCGDTLSDRLCEAPTVDASTAAIVQGTVSRDERSTVKVYSETGFCSGTYIGDGIVLTAAHCKTANSVRTKSGQYAAVSDTVPHPDYKPGNQYDIEILFLESDLDLPIAHIGIPVVGDATIQGFGQTYDETNGALNEGIIQVAGFAQGKLFSEYSETVSTDSCFGDSGGPVYQNGKLVGVTSTGNGKAPQDSPCGHGGVYTIPSLHIDWIQAETGISGDHC